MPKIGGVAEVESLVAKSSGGIGWDNGTRLTVDANGQIIGTAKSLTLADLSCRMSKRFHVALADMNTGTTLLPAVANLGYRISDVKVIAIGANAAATANATAVAVYGTFSGSAVAIYTALLAAMTRSAICQFGTTNTSVVVDGAGLVTADYNTAITTRAVTAGNYDLITTTYFDIILGFTLER
jgi:hypothetical protein